MTANTENLIVATILISSYIETGFLWMQKYLGISCRRHHIFLRLDLMKRACWYRQSKHIHTYTCIEGTEMFMALSVSNTTGRMPKITTSFAGF